MRRFIFFLTAVAEVSKWRVVTGIAGLEIGYLARARSGRSTGGRATTPRSARVSRGGRSDLAGDVVRIQAPCCLSSVRGIYQCCNGTRDDGKLSGVRKLCVEGASHLFEEPAHWRKWPISRPTVHPALATKHLVT